MPYLKHNLEKKKYWIKFYHQHTDCNHNCKTSYFMKRNDHAGNWILQKYHNHANKRIMIFYPEIVYQS